MLGLACILTHSSKHSCNTTFPRLFQMDSNAKAYSTLNKPQYDMGSDFIRALNLPKGDKVLDMGCGTGELTKFIADVVGHNGEVVGVDPDEARIKIGQEKFKDVQNVKFFVGNSITGFPHDNEQYYDLHFSNVVFPLVKGNEKKIYLEKAYQCLKPGGRIAMLTGLKPDIKVVDPKFTIEFLSEAEYKELFQDVGLFTDVVYEEVHHAVHFSSFEEFEIWFKTSCYHDIKELDPGFAKCFLQKFTKKEADGRFTFEPKLFSIVGRKEASIN